jgi:hypothetical protein
MNDTVKKLEKIIHFLKTYQLILLQIWCGLLTIFIIFLCLSNSEIKISLKNMKYDVNWEIKNTIDNIKNDIYRLESKNTDLENRVDEIEYDIY